MAGEPDGPEEPDEPGDNETPERSPFVPSPEYRAVTPLVGQYSRNWLSDTASERGQMLTAIRTPGITPLSGEATIRSMAPLLLSYQEATDSVGAELAGSEPGRSSQSDRADTSLGLVSVLAASFVVVVTPTQTAPIEALYSQRQLIPPAEAAVRALAEILGAASTDTDQFLGRMEQFSAHTIGKVYGLLDRVSSQGEGVDFDTSSPLADDVSVIVSKHAAKMTTNAIESMPEREEVLEGIHGELVGVNLRTGSFELRQRSSERVPETIKGKLAEGLARQARNLTVGSHYNAALTSRTGLDRRTKSVRTRYVLMELDAD